MDGMERFLAEGNIASYLEKLQQEERPSTRNLLKELLLAEERRFAGAAERHDCIERMVADCNQKIAQLEIRMSLAMSSGAELENFRRVLANLQDVRATLLARLELAAKQLDEPPIGHGDSPRD